MSGPAGPQNGPGSSQPDVGPSRRIAGTLLNTHARQLSLQRLQRRALRRFLKLGGVDGGDCVPQLLAAGWAGLAGDHHLFDAAGRDVQPDGVQRHSLLITEVNRPGHGFESHK